MTPTRQTSNSPLRDAFVNGGSSPIEDTMATSNPNVSPEADKAAQAGNSQVATPGGNAPATPTPAPTIAPPTDAWSKVGSNLAAGQPTPVVQPQTTAAPLALYGHSDIDQARILTDWLKSQGAPVTAFDVGGTSKYDQEINSLIDQINNPSANDAQRKQLAQDLAALVNLRNQGVEGAKYKYDPASGQLQAPTGTPGTRTTGDLIGSLGQSPAPIPPSAAPTQNNSLLYQLIGEQLKGGVTAGPELAASKSRLISDLEGSEATQRAQLAGATAGQTGALGGYLGSQLGGLEGATQKAKASGLSNLELGALDRQAASKQIALTALLQQSGLDASSAQQAAALLTQRQISQAGLAQGQDQLGQSGQIAGAQLGVQQRGQDINYVIELLRLAAAGDTDAANRAMQILLTMGQG